MFFLECNSGGTGGGKDNHRYPILKKIKKLDTGLPDLKGTTTKS